MSTAVLENEASVAAEIISVLSAGVIVAPPQNLFLEISVPDLGGGYFRLELTDLDDSEVEDGRIVVRAAVDAHAGMVVTLFGESNSEGFHTKRVSIGFETALKTAESDFRKATLRAALSLATQTRLVTPGLSLDLWFRLNEPLRDISEMLKVRQTMYRLMTIERATGRRFKVPPFIVGEDMEAISFLYHAITERSFGWPFGEVLTVSYKASKDIEARLEQANQSPDFTYPFSHHKSLFGIEIPLGEITLTIINKYIEDFEQVLEEFKKDDGHIVAVKVRSRIGLAHYGVPNAPRLPAETWNNDLQMLIDMEGQLDAALVERYNDLAAASLAGLNESERAEITARPEIGEAFLIEDTHTESV
jgi:hypothetical protein